MSSRSRSLALPLLLLTACGSGDASVALFFPNEASRTATQRVVVEVYNPETGATSSERDCQDYNGLAREGKSPSGIPVRGDYKHPFPSDTQELAKVPSGRMIIYVKGFAASDDEAPAILEGCTDKFDSQGGSDESEEVPVRLHVVIPASTRLVKAGGDRQVGRAGSMLAVPLRVRVEADSPASGGGATYVVPGVTVDLNSMDADFRLDGGDGRTVSLTTDAEGEAAAGLQLPAVTKSGRITAHSTQIEEEGKADRASAEFSVTVAQPVSLQPATVIAGSYIPIELALGRLSGGGPLDLAVLACEGDSQTCVRGAGARSEGPFGNTKLTVVRNVGGSANAQQVAGSLGILPASVSFADLEPPEGPQEIALLNSRRQDCVTRTCPADRPCACYGREAGMPCPCESSEVLVLKDTGGNLAVARRMALTSSNGVQLVPYRSAAGHYLNLAALSQGRALNLQPCSQSNRCLPADSLDSSEACRMNAEMCVDCLHMPEACECRPQRGACDGRVCAKGSPGCICKDDGEQGDPCERRRHPESSGCPPAERCDCAGGDCTQTQMPGVCVPRDKAIDMIANRWNLPLGTGMCGPAARTGRCPSDDDVCVNGVCQPRGLYNKNGCQLADVRCYNYEATRFSTCACGDVDNESMCRAMDGCNCRVPERVHVGASDSPTFPFGLAAGPLKNESDWDLVAGTISGFERLEARAAMRDFEWKDEPAVNAPIHGVLVASVDSNSDATPDVVWYSRESCLSGESYQKKCPIFRDLRAPEVAKGCVGVYYTSRKDSIFDVDPPDAGGCRRYQLGFVPASFCAGDFNGDGATDVAVSSRSEGYVAIFSGDGLGGLLDPPEQAALPPGGFGGPMACGDVDGNQRDDVVVADAATGTIYVLKSGS